MGRAQDQNVVIDISPRELIIDNFAGGGGASLGIEQALGRHIDIAINHDAEALSTHTANHPHTKHFIESVWDVDPKKVCGGRPVGLAWFSPDCFPAGTLILTSQGYRPIETIKVGDLVLTHKQRWRKVTGTHTSVRPLTEVRGHGHPGIRVSPEHPFYVKRRTNRWVNSVRQSRPFYSKADWAPASMLGSGWYWATPTKVPSLPIPKLNRPNNKTTSLPIDERLMWLAGRYLGDGWTRLTDTRGELVIICGKHEADAIRGRLDQWPRKGPRVKNGELSWHSRETRTSIQFTANSRALVAWLRENFLHGAQHKSFPAWAFGMKQSLRRALLEGYLSADGWMGKDWKGKEIVEAQTISKALAYGLRTMASGLGYIACVYYNDKPNSIIEGRIVNAKPVYRVRWRSRICAGHEQTFMSDGLRWSPIREQTKTSVRTTRVYNVSVEGDESYVAEGVVVHNCKHHSKARGSKPVNKKIRGLAWVVVRWAKAVKPRVIALENVEEFKEWGSVMHAVDKQGKLRFHADGTPVMVPNPKRTGETFRRWKRELEKLGYKVEHRELRAHEYGAPTIRKRLFVIARCDGQPIRWPETTHGPGKLPYRTAAECIDFSVPAQSIFERKRQLADGTMRRVAKGLKRYVLESKEPFIVRTGHWSNITGEGFQFRGQGINEPLATVCATNDKAVVVPYIATCNHQGEGFRGHGVNEPTKTLTAARDAHGLVMPYLIGAGGPARSGEPKTVDAPMNTLLAKCDQRLMVPFLAGVGGRAGQSRPRGLNEPTATVTAKADQGIAVPIMVRADAHKPEAVSACVCGNGEAVAASYLLRLKNHADGADLGQPLHTIHANGQHFGFVTPYLTRFNGKSVGQMLHEPLGTTLCKSHDGVVAPLLVGIDHRGSGDSASWDAKKPLTTVTAENRHALTATFLVKQNGGHESSGWPVDKPISTITTKDHHWPAMVKLTPEQASAYDRADHAEEVSKFLREYLGEEYADGIVHLPDGDYRIVDIGLRMLRPRELYNAQGFTPDYIIDPVVNGKRLSQSAQVRMCGNSVSPVMSRAIILANFSSLPVEKVA